ncbi:MAG: D-alanyl-D-alanine carboxypeptidase family protein [Acidimicrobiia bacterium]|nr:D-alanyl-D-alanine carboxypeptidase family protein [Acidimicrobiia bacterium]
MAHDAAQQATTTTLATPSTATSTTAAADPPPAGLVDIDPSITVRLRYATTNNFTGAVLPGYEANRGLLRPRAAGDLAAVAHVLRQEGLALVVLDAYRPVRATMAMVAWAQRTGNSALVGPYIASHSEHNLGVAVDVTLVNVATGTELDMGAPFDTFSPAAHYGGVSGAAFANRQRLRSAMEAAGFVPYDNEWWHFSVPDPGAVPLDEVIR